MYYAVVSEEEKRISHKCKGDERLIAIEMLKLITKRLGDKYKGEEG
jgi:hypothetical protein